MIARLLPLLLIGGAFAQAEPVRLVTLGGAVTEIAFALGAGPQIVGVDQSSTLPVEAASKPQCGYVRTISAEGILALNPSIILATSDLGPPRAVEQLREAGVHLVIIAAPQSPDQLTQAIREIGTALDRTQASEQLAARVQRDLNSAIPSIGSQPTRTVFLMAPQGAGQVSAAGSGTRADALIRLAGGTNAFGSVSGYKPASREALAALDPEVILVAATGTNAAAATHTLRDAPGWSELRAVREARIHPIDLGTALNFGPSLPQAVRETALLLNP